MKLPIFSAVLCAALLCLGRSAAQGTSDLLTTLGTTVTASGQSHAYLLWQPGESAATLGKRFAIYEKSGPADSPASYARLGIQTLQSSPNTIRALLELGSKVDRAASMTPTRITGLYEEIILNPGGTAATPPDPSLDAAEKLSFLIQSAVTDPRTLSRLFFLGRAHPGVMLALGHAFSAPVKSGIHTYEVREVGLSDQDIQVVGRVTLDTDLPIVLDSPASPVRVQHPVHEKSQHTVNPKDHLNARMRWGVGNDLRIKMPHSFGFDVFRVEQKTAERLGWHTHPPTPAEMISALAGELPTNSRPAVSMANELPVLVGDLLTPAQAADPKMTEQVDFSDDGIWYTGPDGKKIRRPYANGEAFYYFIAARGITGEPGQLSSGSLMVMCDRLPPMPPSIVAVRGEFVTPSTPATWAAQGGSQFLQVKIQQLPTTPTSESASGYYVYRWGNSQEYLNHLGNPFIGRINAAPLPQIAGTYLTFSDNGTGSPTMATHANRSVWYTVRAVGRSACGDEVLSGHSAPMAGVLRDFKAPDGPTGDFVICRTQPIAEYEKREVQDPVKNELPEGYTGIGINLRRESETIVASTVEVSVSRTEGQWSMIHHKRYHFQSAATLRVNLPITQPKNTYSTVRIRVFAISSNGRVSEPAVNLLSDLSEQVYAVHFFKLRTTRDCTSISLDRRKRPVHEGFDLQGTVTPIQGSLLIPADQNVREWRVYRRIDDGEASLIAKGEGDQLPLANVWTDSALPNANGTEICYYGQILDQNANPSPLVPLGCVTVENPDLPTPMLADAKLKTPSGTLMNVRLEWFCDPAGVDRFEILAAREGGGDPLITGLSPRLDETPLGEISADHPELSFFRYQTSRVGSAALGTGPSFAAEIQMPGDAKYFFAVRACGSGAPDERCAGSASNVTSARWLLPAAGPQPVIPWPARPLPSAFDARQSILAYQPGEGPLWAAATPADFDVATVILAGLTQVPVISSGFNAGGTTLNTQVDPVNFLFKLRENHEDGETLTNLMPCMLFRYQVPSSLFAAAKPNLVQCTPLIDRLSWKSDEKSQITIRDPYFEVLPLMAQLPLPVAGDWSSSVSPVVADPKTYTPLPPYLQAATAMFLLKDPLPVTVGAKYRHLIVQFDPRGEIKRVIPLDPVQH